MRLSKIVPEPTINSSKRWSSQYSPYSLHYVTILQGSTSTPFRLRPEGSVAGPVDERGHRAELMSRYIVVYGWYCCTQQVEKYRWYMLSCCPCLCQNQSKLLMIYEIFADFSGVLHTATRFCRTCSKLFADASEIIDFIGGAPMCQFFVRFEVYTIKQIRVFVASILQPEMKVLTNRPRPMNKYRKRWIFSNSPYSLHYVSILQG